MSTNLIIVSGALSKHELRYTPKGTPLLEISLVGKREVARNHVFFRTDLTFYGKLAEAWSDGLEDGRAYQAGGRLEYESWEKDGVKGSRLRIVGDELFALEEADLRDEGKGPILYGAENRVLLSGNLTADPEIRQTANKTPVAKAQLGFSTWDYSAGQAKSHFVELEAWRTLAAQFTPLKKGSAVLVEGALKTEVWEDEASGAKRYKRVLEAQAVTRLSRVHSSARAA
ncbi:MAG: single-stranded DNA-binding protein [Meiothermus sp.]